MENYSIADILQYRNWRHALFTTYALSLTFFESFVMRELRSKGCRDVSLVVDADGYQMSLSERRSSLVGQDYRLIPVALPRGVFHAKCMYLSSDEGDVLVVGSGNMTFGGFGRNLEVFEVLTPETSPMVFDQFADFLEYLSIREDWVVPETTWLEKYSRLARRSSEKVGSGPEDQPRLWHTVAETAVDQLAGFMEEKGAVEEVNILSPFFDNDGSAVMQLTKKLNPEKINIGLPTKGSQVVNFPFDRMDDWGGKLGAFKPVVSSGNRNLHAKWFQIRTRDEVYDLTGSINATNKALCSTENVEVGILRKSSLEDDWLTVEPVSPPGKTSKFLFKPSGLGNKCLVYATLRQDSTLLGFVLWNGDLEGEWLGSLETKSGEYCEFNMRVDENGAFKCRMQLKEQILFGSGLQIRMSKDEVVGRGWVNHDDILRLTKEQRSLVRLINREETAEDEVALLDYLAVSAAKHQLAFKSPILNHKKKKPDEKKGEDATNISIELASIAPDRTSFEEDDPLTLLSGNRTDVMTQLRRILLGHDPNANAGDDEDDVVNPDDPEAQRKTKKQKAKEQQAKRAAKTSLDNFYAAMNSIVREAEGERARKTALVIWFEVSMFMYRRHKQVEEGIKFQRDWFWRVAQEHYSEAESGALEQHFVTAAAVMAAKCVDEGLEKEKLLMQIHETLESYWRGSVDYEYAKQALIDDLDIGFAGFLIDEPSVDLSKALVEVFQTRTIRDVLNEQVQKYALGESLDEAAMVFAGSSGEDFLSTAKKRRGVEFFKLKNPGPASYCPKCFMKLTEKQKNNLQYSRLAHCLHCSYFILDLEP